VTPTASSAAPATSTGSASRARDSFRRVATRKKAIAPRGMLIEKMDLQPKCTVRNAPTSGPTSAAKPQTPEKRADPRALLERVDVPETVIAIGMAPRPRIPGRPRRSAAASSGRGRRCRAGQEDASRRACPRARGCRRDGRPSIDGGMLGGRSKTGIQRPPRSPVIVGMAVERRSTRGASAVTSTSAAVTARRRAGSNRGGGGEPDMSDAESHNRPAPGLR
jgi:hypothetical protein